MTDTPPDSESDDSRFTRRYQSRSRAIVIREDDLMRTGIEAVLHDISAAGLGLSLEPELKMGEQVKIRLINEIQRFEKEVRGTVRRVTPLAEGGFFCGIELYTRLTPLDISMARTNIVAHPDNEGPLWV